MEWLQVMTIAGSTIGACWFFRKESAEEIKLLRRDLIEVSREAKEESKEFHGRLCTLEEKYIHMMERFLENKNK